MHVAKFFAVVQHLLCTVPFSSRTLNPDTGIQERANTDSLVSRHEVSSNSDVCLKAEWVNKDFEKPINHQNDIDHLMSSLNALDVDVCLTPECIKAATDIANNLNVSADPCNDFYQFACGGWLNNHAFPKQHRSDISVHSKLRDDIFLKLRFLLEKDSKEKEPHHIFMLKKMYKSCMDSDGIENLGNLPLLDVLNNLGGWPLLRGDNWNAASFDWIDTLGQLRRMGYDHNILMGVSVTKVPADNFYTPVTNHRNSHIITLDRPSFGTDREILLQPLNPTKQLYLDWMQKAANEMGSNPSISKVELQRSAEFEENLAKGTTADEERISIDNFNQIFTVSFLSNLEREIDWLKFFKVLLDEDVTEYDSLLIRDPKFLFTFADLIKKTNKRTIGNYMMWRVVHASLPFLSEYWRSIADSYSLKKIEAPRWRQCISSLSDSALEVALNSYYARHYLNEENKESVLKIAEYIQREVLNILETKDWLDENNKEMIKNKINATAYSIGYQKELLNETLLSQLYTNLTLDGESYLNKTLQLRKWKTDYSFSQLRRNDVEIEWEKYLSPITVNSAYNRLENIIELPVGHIQYPFFSKDLPQYLNFGTIGFTLAREFTHGLQFAAKQLAAQQLPENPDWPDEIYETKAQCLEEQYRKYIAENGMRINGERTLSENIADNGGLKGAYLAYMSYVKDHGNEITLPGLNFTTNQLFWISAANIWCESINEHYLNYTFISRKHATKRFRTNGPMSNLPEFARDFHCLPGVPMNRKTKCEVW
ncbi:neprilysin-2-like [Stegodyphus dumicola]|uniref:neprilysin-2-like n=1 Tax=Stegodyphus dumicola TaxID=202533 RepID=UPI0015AD6D18|nr:neprilysin-2-like [Stegodyphus dumicola]